MEGPESAYLARALSGSRGSDQKLAGLGDGTPMPRLLAQLDQPVAFHSFQGVR